MIITQVSHTNNNENNCHRSDIAFRKCVRATNIALDNDAQKRAIEIAHKFLNQGKRVFLIEMADKDPSEMGFEAFTKHVQQAEELDLGALMLHKLQL